MIVPDVNLLIYAYAARSPHHERARGWWNACLSGRQPIGLAHVVMFAFLRIATNARIIDRPMTLDHAAQHVRSWLERSVTRVLMPDTDHVERVADLLAGSGAAGNLVTDAQIAALALAHNGVVHTADHDFRRFPSVQSYFPLHP